jgi:hypothetical protein
VLSFKQTLNASQSVLFVGLTLYAPFNAAQSEDEIFVFTQPKGVKNQFSGHNNLP